LSPSGSRDYLSPPGIRYGAAGPAGPVILVTPGAARGDGFTCYAAVAGPGYGGCRRAAT